MRKKEIVKLSVKSSPKNIFSYMYLRVKNVPEIVEAQKHVFVVEGVEMDIDYRWPRYWKFQKMMKIKFCMLESVSAEAATGGVL